MFIYGADSWLDPSQTCGILGVEHPEDFVSIEQEIREAVEHPLVRRHARR